MRINSTTIGPREVLADSVRRGEAFNAYTSASHLTVTNGTTWTSTGIYVVAQSAGGTVRITANGTAQANGAAVLLSLLVDGREVTGEGFGLCYVDATGGWLPWSMQWHIDRPQRSSRIELAASAAVERHRTPTC